MTDTTSTIKYFTSSDSSFVSGWYLVDENGARGDAATTTVLSDANKVVLGADTPTGDQNPVSGEGGDDVFVVQSDTPNRVVINDNSGDNTLLFSTGITIINVVVISFGGRRAIINFDDGSERKSIEVRAVDNMSFAFESGPVAGRGFDIDQFKEYVEGTPAFTEENYTAEVAEDAANGAVVVTVSAKDQNTGDTLSYSITGGNDDNIFAIDSVTGDITVAGTLDYEALPADKSYTLTVEVSDGNGGTATTTVTVTVTDVNDNAPVIAFAGGSSLIHENAVGVDANVTLTITDADTNNDFTFTITGGRANGVDIPDAVANRFEVVADGNGDWKVKLKDGESIDYEEYPLIVIFVSVSDGVNPASNALRVPIYILDVYEGPEFDAGSYTAELAEDVASGTAVATVSATPYATGDTLSYAITAGDDGNVFAIDSVTGEITVAGTLDRETTGQHRLTVEVSDQKGNTRTVVVTVTVTDVEDEPTVFAGDLTGAVVDVAGSNANIQATGTVRLTDPDTAGVPAGVLSLKDAEGQASALSVKAGTYGTFTFFKTPGFGGAAAKEGSWRFNLDRDRPATLALKDGEVVTETFTLVYTITTPVLDGNGDPVLDDNGDPTVTVETIETNIVITITGADDPFMFNQPDGYVFIVNEDLAVDGIVGQVEAKDYDADTQAAVSYSITSGNDDGFFEINANGQIVLKKGLDFETLPAGKSYTLTVQATDGPNTVTVDVTINVKDVEEGPAVVSITPNTADVDAIDVGTILTASLVKEDPDGLVGVAEWRWFYVSAPYASIGTGETYTVKEDDRGEQIGVARVYQDGIGGKPIGGNEARDVLGKVIPRVAIAPEVNTESGDNTVAAQVDKASKVETGDGSDTITDGNRNDVIIGGKGDDNIDLGHDNNGNDQDQVIYGIGDKSAEDGGDTITNFTRGRDSFIFELAANTETNAIQDMDDFISYLNGGTPDDLSDDQLLVGLDFNINSDGNVELTGLTFHFEDSVFFGGGRISIPVVTIDFSNPMTEAQIISALGGDEAVAATLVNSDGILTNLDYLDDLLGGPDAVGYQVEIV